MQPPYVIPSILPEAPELDVIEDGPLDLWQNPFCEQNGAQQGHPKLELQLPAPLPASTVSASVHSFPFQTLHDPITGTKSGSDGGAIVDEIIKCLSEIRPVLFHFYTIYVLFHIIIRYLLLFGRLEVAVQMYEEVMLLVVEF